MTHASFSSDPIGCVAARTAQRRPLQQCADIVKYSPCETRQSARHQAFTRAGEKIGEERRERFPGAGEREQAVRARGKTRKHRRPGPRAFRPPLLRGRLSPARLSPARFSSATRTRALPPPRASRPLAPHARTPAAPRFSPAGTSRAQTITLLCTFVFRENSRCRAAAQELWWLLFVGP